MIRPTLRRLLRGDNRGQATVEFTLFAMSSNARGVPLYRRHDW